MLFLKLGLLLLALLFLLVGINLKSKKKMFWVSSSSLLAYSVAFMTGGDVWYSGILLFLYGLMVTGYFWKIKPKLDKVDALKNSEKFVQNNKELFTEEEVNLTSNYKKEYAGLEIQKFKLTTDFEEKFQKRFDKITKLMEKK